MTVKKTKWARLKDWRQKTFPDRQIFLRSDGHVRFITVSGPVQEVLALSAIAATVWGAIASYGFFTRDELVAEHRAHISVLEARNAALNQGFDSLEEQLLHRAAELEARQEFLEQIIGSDQIPDNVQKNIIPAAESEQNLKGGITQSKTSVTSEKSFWAFWPGETIDQQEPDLDARHTHLAMLFTQMASDQDKMAAEVFASKRAEAEKINEALKKTNLTVATLAESFDQMDAAGGPFVPSPDAVDARWLTGHTNRPYKALWDLFGDLELAKATLASLPVGKPAADYYISSKFGRRIDPVRKVRAWHAGLDMAGWPGTKILASANGTVVKAGRNGPYGNMVEIDHGNGFKTRYGHMRRLSVKRGEKVTAGQKIGEMGKSGRSTGTHLHYEVWYKGKVTNPQPYLEAARAVDEIRTRYEKGNAS